MRKRMQRHDVIRSIVRENNVRTQRELAEKLQAAGYDCTQATISRDITDMGLVKSESGNYELPEDMRLQRMVSELVEEVYLAGNMVVVKTFPGGAPGVAGRRQYHHDRCEDDGRRRENPADAERPATTIVVVFSCLG